MTGSCTEVVFAAVHTATPETMSRDQLAEHNENLRRLRSWIDAEEVRVTRRARELQALGHAESAESMATRSGGRSSRTALELARRADVCCDMPDVEAALARGDISGGHVDAVARAARRLADDAKAEFEDLSAVIVANAAKTGVDTFERSMRELAASISARHDAQAGVDELEAQRSASRIRRWVDKHSGMHHTHVELDPIRDAKLSSAINAELARLRSTAAATTPWDQMLVDAFLNTAVGTPTSGCGEPNQQADSSASSSRVSPDPAQRRRADRADRVPEITVLVEWRRLIGEADSRGICETENGVPLPVSTVRRLCCDAEVLPVVLGGHGEVLDAGRSIRTASRPQRRALRAMHRTCAHPDCTVGFDACRIHHVRWWWEHHGATDVDNLLPVCERHHHLVHEGGWELTMAPDRIATWIRPDGTLYHRGQTIDRRPPYVPQLE